MSAASPKPKVTEDQINNFNKALGGMEQKIHSIESELSTFYEERKRAEMFQQHQDHQSDSSALTERGLRRVSNEELESMTIQVQRLQQENRNIADELGEWKQAYSEKASQCELNRDKYLKAQQIAEEYRRQLETIGKDNSMSQEQINTGLQLTNERIKEQLGELGHLPFILEAKQLELQETLSKLKLAERTICALSDDLEGCIVKCELLQKDVEHERTKNLKLHKEGENFLREINEWKQKFDELTAENKLLLKGVERMRFLEECLEVKTREVHKLGQHLEELREESSRHVSRVKERAEVQKKAFHSQISGLEEELVQLRANLSTAFKERDEVRQRMQGEVSKLEQKFADAQLEIRSLKSHVEILKSSYSNMFESYDDEESDNGDDDETEKDESSHRFTMNHIRKRRRKNQPSSQSDHDTHYVRIKRGQNHMPSPPLVAPRKCPSLIGMNRTSRVVRSLLPVLEN